MRTGQPPAQEPGQFSQSHICTFQPMPVPEKWMITSCYFNPSQAIKSKQTYLIILEIDSYAIVLYLDFFFNN